MKLEQLIDKVIDIFFRWIFAWFGGLGPRSRPFSIYQPIAINQKPTKMSL